MVAGGGQFEHRMNTNIRRTLLSPDVSLCYFRKVDSFDCLLVN